MSDDIVADTLKDTPIEGKEEKAFKPVKELKEAIERPVWSEFKKTDAAKAFDQFIARILNITLFRTAQHRMTEEDINNLGAAVLYSIAYYSPVVAAASDSPIAVVFMAIVGFVIALNKKITDNQQSQQKTGDQQKAF